MIAKKNKKANLERKRFAFFQIGLLISGSLCLAAFEWSTAVPNERVEIMEDDNRIIDLEPTIDADKFKIIKEKPKTRKLVNLDNIEKLKIVKTLTKTGNLQTTKNSDIIFIPGDDDCIFCGIDTSLEPEGGTIWDFPEIEPEFPGGAAAMAEWLGSKIVYPELPADMGIGGYVYIEFVVNEDGSIEQVKSKGAPHSDLSDEGMRVVNQMPKWKPGEQAGKPVRVRFTLPINFVAR